MKTINPNMTVMVILRRFVSVAVIAATLLVWAQKPVEQPAQPAQGNAATVQKSGTVTVNGETTQQPSTTVFQGDRIETTTNAAAVITTEGSTIVVPANTQIVYGNNIITIGCGQAAVTTVRGLVTTIPEVEVKVTPTSQTAKYEVVHVNNSLKIKAKEGGLRLMKGNAESLVAAGATATFSSAAACLLPAATAVIPGTIGTAATAAASTAALASKEVPPASPVIP